MPENRDQKIAQFLVGDLTPTNMRVPTVLRTALLEAWTKRIGPVRTLARGSMTEAMCFYAAAGLVAEGIEAPAATESDRVRRPAQKQAAKHG